MSFPVVPGAAGLVSNLLRAGLGQTRDPRELVPGLPEGLQRCADELRRQGERLESVGQELGRMDVPGWQGPASNAFWDRFAGEGTKWLLASEAMMAAADALTRHGETLAWAQEQAAQAIDLWERGEAATEQALAEHNALVEEARRRANAVTSALDQVLPLDVPQFFDPGAELRQQAEELLGRARQQVDESGNQTARQLEGNAGDAPDSPSWLRQVAGVAETAIRDHGAFDFTFKNETEWDLISGDAKDKPGWKLKLLEAQHANSVWGWDGEGQTQWGEATLSGEAELQTLGYDGAAELSITSERGLQGELSGKAYLAHAAAEGSVEYGIAEVGASGEAFVGAEAEAKVAAGPDGFHAGAEAFAGAKAEGEVHADVGGVGVGATGEAWAGVGAEANVTAGRNDDGSWTVGGSAGAAFKAGGKLGFEVTVDPPKVIDTATSAASAVGDFVGSATDAVGDTVGRAKFW